MGWDEFFQSRFDEIKALGLFPARIISQARGHYYIQFAHEEIIEASITTKLHNSAKESDDFPAVGDWVVFTMGQGRDKASIHQVLERKSSLQRKRSGNAGKSQHLATNVDSMLIVTSLNEDFDLARLGRYVDLGKDSGASTHFILTKSDLCPDPQEYVRQLKTEFPDVDVLLTSSKEISTLEALQKFFVPGKTAVLLGSSGVGKSTITNYLVGLDLQKTGEVASEAKGRHTTTSRNLLFTRWGGLVIDTPGMQEILASGSEDKKTNFTDVEELMLKCKFTNCRHQSDPGCAVSASLKKGELPEERWAAYLKAASKIAAPFKKPWQK